MLRAERRLAWRGVLAPRQRFGPWFRRLDPFRVRGRQVGVACRASLVAAQTSLRFERKPELAGMIHARTAASVHQCRCACVAVLRHAQGTVPQRVALRVRATTQARRGSSIGHRRNRAGFHSVTVPHEVALHVARDNYDAAGWTTAPVRTEAGSHVRMCVLVCACT